MTHPDLPPPETVHGDIVTGGGRHPHMIGILLMLTALILINCSDAVAKLTIEQVPVYQVALFQATAMIFAVPFIARTTNLPLLVRTRRPGLQLIRSCCQFASAICFFSGLGLLPLVDVIAIIMLGPLVVTALAAVVLKEKVGPRRWLACGFGLAGALIMIRPTFDDGMGWPALLPLGAVCFFSVYAVITRMLAPHEGTGTMMFWGAIVGFRCVGRELAFLLATADAGDLARPRRRRHSFGEQQRLHHSRLRPRARLLARALRLCRDHRRHDPGILDLA